MIALLDISLLDFCLAVFIVAIGTAIQASIGFGVALVAAPILLLINRNLVPGPLIAAALFLVIWMAYSDRHAINMSHFKVAIIGRIVGTIPAAFLIGSVSAVTFDIVFGSLVLMAVVMSLIHTNIQVTPRNLFLATIAAGFMSTISSIGGPPQALVYQNSLGAELRANLSVLFAMGCAISLLALSLVGRFHLQDILYSLMLFVGVVIGKVCSGPLKRQIDRHTARPFLLGLCGLSSLLVLIRAALSL